MDAQCFNIILRSVKCLTLQNPKKVKINKLTY